MSNKEVHKKILKNFFVLFTLLILPGIAYYGVHFYLLFNNKQYENKVKINTWVSRLTEFQQKHNRDNYWKEIKYDKKLSSPELTSNDWSYPWYIVKHDYGFENILGEKITSSDTTKLIHNSKVFTFQNSGQIEDNEFRSHLNFAECNLKNDLIEIKIIHESASNAELFLINIYKDLFFVEYKNSYVFPYERLEINNISSELKLNSEPEYKVGQKLIGDVTAVVTEQLFKLDGKSEQAERRTISGKFEVIIK